MLRGRRCYAISSNTAFRKANLRLFSENARKFFSVVLFRVIYSLNLVEETLVVNGKLFYTG